MIFIGTICILNLGYDEHPYWLIEKMNFILRVTNKTYSEIRKRGS